MTLVLRVQCAPRPTSPAILGSVHLAQNLRDFLGTAGGGLPDFFGGFSPAELTASFLSLIAIGLSGWALFQAYQGRLRPNLQLSHHWDDPVTYFHPTSGVVDEELLSVTVINRGAGDAVDVVVTFDGHSVARSLGNLGRDDFKTASVNSVDLPGSPPFAYKVTWKEYPPRNSKERSVDGRATVAPAGP